MQFRHSSSICVLDAELTTEGPTFGVGMCPVPLNESLLWLQDYEKKIKKKN